MVVEKTSLVPLGLPADLIRPEEPPAPLSEAGEQDPRLVGNYVIDLETWGGSCHFRMAAVRELDQKHRAGVTMAGQGK